MTLSVSTQLKDIPINFSDTVISSTQESENHIVIPSETHINQIIPNDWESHIVNLVRKTYIICNNLIISWAGSKIAAEHILNELIDNFTGKNPSFEQVVNFLTSQNDIQPSLVELVINLVDEKQNRTFKWNSQSPNTINQNNTNIIGSGEYFYTEFLKYSKSFIPSLGNNEESVKIFLSGLCSILFAQEWYLGMNLPHYFGGCFEAGYFANNKFNLLNNYSLMLWSIKKTVDGKLIHPYNEYFRFFYSGNILCIKKYQDVGIKLPPGTIAPGPKLFYIEPLVGKPDIEILKQNIRNQMSKTAAFEPDIYVHVLIVDDELLNPERVPEGRTMIIYYELQNENPKFTAIETKNILKMNYGHKLFHEFDNILKSNFIRSMDLFKPIDF